MCASIAQLFINPHFCTMRYLLFMALFSAAVFVLPVALQAQPDSEVEPMATPVPLDGIVPPQTIQERTTLAHAPVREADIMWEKRIWRVIDTREKMNLPFAAPEAALFDALIAGVRSGDITAYNAVNDKFTLPLSIEAVETVMSRSDTLRIIDPVTYEESTQVVTNEIDVTNVKRYRIKETWWFDTRTSTLNHRILGIAPLMEMYDNDGNFRFEVPLFWVYYPHARTVLAKHKVYVTGQNTATTLSWEDIFEMRHFSSYITQESNVQSLRLEDYLTGRDLLLESQQIQDALFNREQDMWQN
jgi:gliding motility associated protien GldN